MVLVQVYDSVAKGLKLKVRKFGVLVPTFVEVTGKNLVAPPPILNRVKTHNFLETLVTNRIIAQTNREDTTFLPFF